MGRRRGGGWGALVGLAALGVTLALAGGAFAATALSVPGIGLLALALVLAVALAGAARGASVRRTVKTARVVEGDEVVLSIAVCRGVLPLPGASVRDPLVDAPLDVRGRGRRVELVARARLERRGRHALPAPTLVLRDPLGLAARVVAGPADGQVLVLPRTSPVITPGGGAFGLGVDGAGAHVVGAEIDPDGLRPHRPGAPASRIYWPALARGTGLVERRRRPEPEGQPLVVLDPRDAAAPRDLDAAVRAAASLCLALARRGGCSALLPGARRPVAIDGDLGGWAGVHARLALIDGDSGSPAPAVLGAHRGTVVYVVARRLGRPPRVLDRAPRGSTRILVVPGPADGASVLFEVAGCHGRLVGAPRRGVATPPARASTRSSAE